MEVDWCGVHLALLPDRAVYWPERETLLVADLHLGKDAAFRHRGIALPTGVGASDLDRLGALVDSYAVRRLVFLGDLLHARAGMTASTLTEFSAWRSHHPNVSLVLVRGNHDRSAGDPPSDWNIECVSEPLEEGDVRLCHYPPQEMGGVPSIAGHLHPAVTLTGPANTSMVLPCFWMRPRVLVLPAFTDFAGRPQIAAASGDRIFVTGDGQVVEVSSFAYR